jgi:predicted  nucleic acid-binding Zn-ribbon protein
MIARSATPSVFSAEVEDIAHGCSGCGTELIRTVMAERPA